MKGEHASLTNIAQPERIEEEKQEFEHSHAIESVYDRFSNYINENKIERDDFCRAIHIYRTMEELEEDMKGINFKVSKEEIYQIFKDHNAHKTGYLPMEDFYKRLKCWQDFDDKKDAQLREIRD